VTFSCFLSPSGHDLLQQQGDAWAKALETVRGTLRRLRDVPRVSGFDLVLVHREALLFGPPWIEALAARRRPLVFDLDDAIYLPTASGVNRWVAALRPASKTARVCRMARHVTAGNSVLANFARQHSRAVTVIATTIDTDVYRPRRPDTHHRPVVGWTGSGTTLPYLGQVAGALRRVARDADFELRVIGGEARLEGVSVHCQPWRPASEVEDILQFDIGIMPLADDEWSRGKCGLKALQYMALEIPPVLSPVGVNTEIVRDGVDGLHARTEDEWVAKLLLLLRDPELRRRLGSAARRTVEERYSAKVQAPLLAQVLREAAG
jgi:glycosyltransferase involved in cell wall biosynthesis